jgi:PPK2 family polyphosphate:nucleotide phosphotransferase
MTGLPQRYRIRPHQRVDLGRRDPGDRTGFAAGKAAGRRRLQHLQGRLEELQEALYAEGRHRLLVVLQAMDAGGKDGVIRSVFDGVNPQGVRVHCFKQPNEVERAHDFLWRIHPQVPGNGEIAIFNRSHYEDVLVARVHGLVPEKVWRARYQHIVAFEQMLVDEGTTILKFFLHISRAEQRRRLQERIDDPSKRWKFNAADLAERSHWVAYQRSYADAIAATTTARAPWFIVPADHNWYRDLVVAEVLVAALDALRIRLPKGDPELRHRLVE